MIIEKNKVVSLTYTLVVDGDVLEKVTEQKPMQFIFGDGYLLPKFEEQIAGLKVGDSFEFVLSAKDAYGEFDDNAVIDIPIDAFKDNNGKIEEGLLVKDKVIPMMDQEGNRLQGIVEEVSKDFVKMNFNHPLAGEALSFTGKVADIREATEKELTEGLFGEKVHHCHDCGCGDHCGDGCGDHCGDDCGCGCH